MHGFRVLADSAMLWSGACVTAAFGKGHVACWFPTLTMRNGLDISGSQWSTSPIHGKVGSAVRIEIAISILRLVALDDVAEMFVNGFLEW